MKKEITCYCEHKFYITVDEEINVCVNERVLDDIENAQFQKGECPNCGTVIRAEFFTRFIFPDKHIVIAYVPEQDRLAYFNADMENESIKKIQKDDMIVIGFLELLDRIRVLRGNLDPAAIECAKYFLIEDAYEKFPDAKGIFMLFKKYNEKNDLQFYVYGLKEDEAAVIDLPKKTYDQIKSDIEQKVDEDLYNAIQNGNYISVENILFEDDEDENAQSEN